MQFWKYSFLLESKLDIAVNTKDLTSPAWQFLKRFLVSIAALVKTLETLDVLAHLKLGLAKPLYLLNSNTNSTPKPKPTHTTQSILSLSFSTLFTAVYPLFFSPLVTHQPSPHRHNSSNLPQSRSPLPPSKHSTATVVRRYAGDVVVRVKSRVARIFIYNYIIIPNLGITQQEKSLIIPCALGNLT